MNEIQKMFVHKIFNKVKNLPSILSIAHAVFETYLDFQFNSEFSSLENSTKNKCQNMDQNQTSQFLQFYNSFSKIEFAISLWQYFNGNFQQATDFVKQNLVQFSSVSNNENVEDFQVHSTNSISDPSQSAPPISYSHSQNDQSISYPLQSAQPISYPLQSDQNVSAYLNIGPLNDPIDVDLYQCFKDDEKRKFRNLVKFCNQHGIQIQGVALTKYFVRYGYHYDSTCGALTTNPIKLSNIPVSSIMKLVHDYSQNQFPSHGNVSENVIFQLFLKNDENSEIVYHILQNHQSQLPLQNPYYETSSYLNIADKYYFRCLLPQRQELIVRSFLSCSREENDRVNMSHALIIYRELKGDANEQSMIYCLNEKMKSH